MEKASRGKGGKGQSNKGRWDHGNKRESRLGEKLETETQEGKINQNTTVFDTRIIYNLIRVKKFR